MTVDLYSKVTDVVQFHCPAALIHPHCCRAISNLGKIQLLKKKNYMDVKHSDVVKKYNEHMGSIVLFDMLIDGTIAQLIQALVAGQ